MRDVLSAPGIEPIVDHFGDLPAQPKANIASALGTPEIYPDLQTAVSESNHFIARSEHPYELFYSGLTNSYRSTSGIDAIHKLDRIFQDPNRSFDALTDQDRGIRLGYIEANMWRYLAFGGQFSGPEADAFARQHSLSYWQYVDGDNLYMVEDSGHKGRYYVGKINGAAGVAVIEDGNVVEQMSWGKGPGYPPVDSQKLIEFYEATRNSDMFDSANCPLIELVDPGAEKPPVFLQYHPTNQAAADNQFEVDNPTDTFIVRGATPPEGIELKLYTRQINSHRQPIVSFGCGPIHQSDAESEYFSPLSDLVIVPSSGREDEDGYRRRFLNATIDHGTRTDAFKPRVTIGIAKALYECIKASSDTFDGSVDAYIVSNGLRAQLQYYDKRSRSVVTV